ncbi:MAG: beta-L-arabinofuranosidase domain-containing protein [Bryobacteraceae bacterium]
MTYTSFPNSVSRRHVLALLGLLAGDACRTPARFPGRKVADVLSPIPLGDVQLGGCLGRKLDLCIGHRIFAQDPAKLVVPFRHREERSCWQTEFWGKWFLSAAAACEYTGNRDWRERLRESAHELLATQSPDGYIGNYAAGDHLHAWDVWGRKYTLLGLLAGYDLTADSACLSGARRLADELMREVGPLATDIVTLGLYRGMAASSVLQPMVRLFRRTGDPRYLQFAAYIVARWSSPRGPQLVEKALAGVPVGRRFPRPDKWWSWENGEKAYEMMSCYTGLLELYREMGWQPGLNATVRTFESIRDTEINVAGSGSAGECWYGGRALEAEARERSMETCVAVSWNELCASLLRITGDPRFADEIERTAYNALAGAMTPDGSSFAQYSSLAGVRSLGPPQCGMELNCCTANGPRGLLLLPEVAVMLGAEGPAISLYSDGVWKFRLPSGAPCRLSVKTDYPESGEVNILIEPARAEFFSLRLRIPQWSEETTATVNGAAVGGLRPGTWAAIGRRWTPADSVRLRLDVRGRILRTSAGDKRYVAIIRGPVALARDLRLTPGGLDEPVSLDLDGRGRISLRETVPPAGISTAFVAAGGLALCDYASAGNTWDRRSRFRTWLPT